MAYPFFIARHFLHAPPVGEPEVEIETSARSEETIDLVYEAAWAQIIARGPFRDVTKDPKREEHLRKKIFAVARPGAIDFDTLLEKVLWMSPEMWIVFAQPGGLREISA